MSFKPMKLRKPDHAIFQSNSSNAFKLSPISFSVSLAEYWKYPNTASNRDIFNLGDFANDLKFHHTDYVLGQTALQEVGAYTDNL